MVRNYIRKSERQKWDENAMQTALEEISNGMPFKRAARIFGLPLSTLKRRAKGQNKLATGHSKHLGRYVTTLPKNIETALKNYALEMEDRLFGLTKKNICEMAYQLAERNSIIHRFSRNKQAAGTAWFQEFLHRNPELSFRTPEATSAARARGFNKEAVAKFFSNLDDVFRMNNIGTDPMRIYNMDESGIQTVPAKLPKVVAHKGRKQVGSLTSAERGQSISIVLCVNATGQFIPPAVIFPRKRRNELLYQGLPYGTLCLHNESGYMKTDTFVQFLQHFQKHTQSSVERKVLLLLDGHSTHKTLEAIEYCRANGIILLSFPPHCTHEMQPLDVAVFSPFMTYYNEEINLWLKANPGKVVTLYNIGTLFGKAYRRAATPNNGLSGFEKTGIFPFNPNIFPDWRYKPSCTTDRPIVASNNNENLVENPAIQKERTPPPQLQMPCSSGMAMKSRKIFTCAPYQSSSSEESDDWQHSGRSSDESIFENDEGSNDFEVSLDTTPLPVVSSNENNNKIVTPFDISPLPVAPPETRSSRPSQGATVFTSTPNYNIVKEKSDINLLKISNKSKKAATRKIFPETQDKNKKDKDNINRLKASNKPKKAATNNICSETKDKNKKDEDEADAACIFCSELFSNSAGKEKWIKCNSCQQWAHTLCAGVGAGKKVYICDVCV